MESAVQTDDRLFSRQVDLLYQQANGAALASVGAAVLVSLAVAGAVPFGVLLVWGSLTALSALLRLALYAARTTPPAGQ